MMGGTRDEIVDALSNAWIDGQSLRTYRHAPNAGLAQVVGGGRRRRAAPCASRWMTLKGEMGYPSALTAKTWGFYDVLFKGKPFRFKRPYGSYVMENVLFKISFPAEFHAQTAVECAVQLHPRGRATGWTTSRRSSSRRTSRRSASSTRRARSTIPPTATTASST